MSSTLLGCARHDATHLCGVDIESRVQKQVDIVGRGEKSGVCGGHGPDFSAMR